MDEEEYLNQEAGPSNPAASSATIPNGSVPLSKKAQKRAAKQARIIAERPEKRKAEKLRRRENAQKLAEGYKNGTLTPEEKAIYDSRQAAKAVKLVVKKREKLDPADRPDFGGAVVIDLDFDELMSEQEVTSMVGQIGYVYSANRLADRPFKSVLHTSCSPTAAPRIYEKMQKTKHDKWSRCYWHEQGIEDLARKFGESSTATEKEVDGGIELPNGISPSTHQLIYLSADSDNELETLSENEIYIIGGIVDRNRYKNLCQEKAEKYGIKTARLPIGRYLENLSTRKVLTVNQVFSILVEYVTRQSWSEAFEAVIPQRKFQTVGRREKRGKSNWTEPTSGEQVGEDQAQGGEDGEDQGDEEMSDMEEAPFDWSRADGGDQADEDDEEAAINV